mmetsp:Transcript_94542/g.273309  ORF Transcript_94542/g.273309 Transcript_94542/m.273309 type:complete len:201 (-) Transcript_94542:915-1517(-)
MGAICSETRAAFASSSTCPSALGIGPAVDNAFCGACACRTTRGDAGASSCCDAAWPPRLGSCSWCSASVRRARSWRRRSCRALVGGADRRQRGAPTTSLAKCSWALGRSKSKLAGVFRFKSKRASVFRTVLSASWRVTYGAAATSGLEGSTAWRRLRTTRINRARNMRTRRSKARHRRVARLGCFAMRLESGSRCPAFNM